MGIQCAKMCCGNNFPPCGWVLKKGLNAITLSCVSVWSPCQRKWLCILHWSASLMRETTQPGERCVLTSLLFITLLYTSYKLTVILTNQHKSVRFLAHLQARNFMSIFACVFWFLVYLLAKCYPIKLLTKGIDSKSRGYDIDIQIFLTCLFSVCGAVGASV